MKTRSARSPSHQGADLDSVAGVAASSRWRPRCHRSPRRDTASAGRGHGVLAFRGVRISLVGFVQQIDLGEAEPGQLDIELQVDEGLELDGQHLLVPTGIERELVVGEHVCPPLGLGEVRERIVGTFSTEQLGGLDPAMAGNDFALIETSTGLLNPKRSMSAICWICFFEWVRAFRA